MLSILKWIQKSAKIIPKIDDTLVTQEVYYAAALSISA